jgi:dephospho-CoA kinase
MIKVGITGGIGSGKSHICGIFQRLGVPVYFADLAARELSDTDDEIRQTLISLMGKDLYAGSKLNRSKMATLIFNNKKLLAAVNRLFYRKVMDHFIGWCGQQATARYVLHESAILFESSAYRMFDTVITVSAPESLRIKRVMESRDMNPENIQAILLTQIPEKEKILLSGFVIRNDDQALVLPQVLLLHKTLMT